MNVVVAGEDVIALSIAEAVMARHSVVYIGPESPTEERFHRLDIETVIGAVTSPSVLRQARVGKADVFVACSVNDEQNIVACLAAQRTGARRTLCVLSQPGFLLPEGGESLAESLGIDQVIRPAEQLADEIVRIISFPGALDVQILEEGRVAMLRLAVEGGAPATRAPLKTLELPQSVNLVMVRRGDEMIIPRGDTQLQHGDKVALMGHRESLAKVASLVNAKDRIERQDAIIVGAGTVGVAVARGLEKAGWHVKLIETDRDRCDQVATLLDSMVLHGDGADLELLEQENASETPVLVAVTNNDEKNLLVSLLAKHLGVERIITRADRLANERMFERVGVDVVRSAHGAALRSIVRGIEGKQSDILVELEHGAACVLELELPAAFPPRRLYELRPPGYAVVGSLLRKNRLVVPRGGDSLKPKDQVLIFCTRDDEERIRRYFLDVEAHRREVGLE